MRGEPFMNSTSMQGRVGMSHSFRHLRRQVETVLFVVLLIGLSVPSCFAGSSILLNSSGTIEAARNVDDDKDLRLEFHMHDYSPTVGSNRTFAYLNFFDLQLVGIPNGEIEVISRRGGYVRCPTRNRTNFLLRVQLNVSAARLDCEVWDVDGSNYAVRTASGLSFSPFSQMGGSIGSFNQSAPALAFLRGSTTLVPFGSKPPATADVGDYFDWKLDSNGNESAGRGIKVDANAFTFVPTSGQIVVSQPKTEGTPSWAPFRPLRAGHAARLDGTSSFSMSDASASVNCTWRQLDGPTQVTFTDTQSCTPTITGLVFGPYSFVLEVTDSSGNTNRAALDAGAVAYDDNGVVIYPDERLYTLLGPSKVLGAGDSDWYDERHVTMAKVNWDNYEVNGGSWMFEPEKDIVNGVPRIGTVYIQRNSTKLHGVGTNLMTVFCGGRPGPAVPIPVSPYINVRTPASRLPVNGYSRIVKSCESETEITFQDGYIWESDDVPYPGVPWGTHHLARFHMGPGSIYRDPSEPTKLRGEGTDFLTKFCGGSAGNAVTGISGSPQIYMVDESFTSRVVVSCQSDTELTVNTPVTSAAIPAPGVSWGWEDPSYSAGQWRVNQTSNVNYYDIALGHYGLYYRTGWRKARDSARWLADRWNRNPLLFTHGPPREFSLTSAILLHTVDTDAVSEEEHENFWKKMTLYAEATRNNTTPPYISDLREDAYSLTVHALLAQFHPDAEKRASRRAAVVDRYVKLFGPLQQAEGQYFNQDVNGDSTRVVSMNHGSSVVTKHSGPDFTPTYCGDPSTFQEDGTIAVTTNSKTVTGVLTNFVGAVGKRILIRGFLKGVPWSQISSVEAVESATLLTLRHPWHGDSENAVSYRIVSSPNGFAPYFPSVTLGIMEVNGSGTPVVNQLVERGNWYWCTVNSGSQLTLDKPYTGDTSTNAFRRIVAGTPGRGSQPFMQGIAAWAFHFAAVALDGHNDDVAMQYRASANKVVDYLYSYASRDLGLPYFTDYEPCLPKGKIPNICDDFDISLRRTYAVETNAAFAWRYLTTKESRDLTMGDRWYTAQFSNSLLPSRFPGDGYVAGLLLTENWTGNTNLTTKNYGQTFGVGAGHIWPAARDGGVAKPIPRMMSVPFDLSRNAMAAQGRIVVFLPSGEVKHIVCPSFPCSVPIDERQGEPVIQKELLDVDGKVVAKFDQELLHLDLKQQ